MAEENITENTETKQRPDHLFKPGQSGNPAGRPKGTENFSTRWFRVLDKIADKNGMEPDEVEDQILAELFKGAKQGNFKFIKDFLDRRFGKPQQDLTVKSISMTPEEFAKQFEIDDDKDNNT